MVPEPKGSSLHSWEPAIGPYPEPGESKQAIKADSSYFL
jgi:hypothetical protein